MASNEGRTGDRGGTVETPSPEHIEAEGDVSTRQMLIRYIVLFSAFLALIGAVLWWKDPTTGKEIWVYLAPLMSAAITGLIGFIAGERQGAAKKKR